LLLAFFNLTAPVVITCFTGHVAMSVISSIIVTSGFSALWLVANELEDPFGYDANDMPMIRYHLDFCANLNNTLRRPWMAKDHWTVKAGHQQTQEQRRRRQQMPRDLVSEEGPPGPQEKAAAETEAAPLARPAPIMGIGV